MKQPAPARQPRGRTNPSWISSVRRSLGVCVVAVLLATTHHDNAADAFAFVAPGTARSAAATRAAPMTRSRTRAALRMQAGLPGGFSLDASTKAFLDGVASAASQLPHLSLPSADRHLSENLAALADAVLRLSVPELALTPGALLGDLSKLANDVALSDPISQISKAMSVLTVTPDSYGQLTAQAAQVSGEALSFASHALDALVAVNPALGGPVDRLEASLGHALEVLDQAYALVPAEYHTLVLTLALGAASTALGMSNAAAREESKLAARTRDAPLPREYDLPAIMGYYNRRPLTLLSRLAEVSRRLGSLGGKLWLDRKVGDGSGWEANMPSRAAEFVDFLQGAGPAFIKIGQGVSIRPDILPESYLRELVKLQDRVQPFDSGEARDILAKQLGKPLREVFLDADTAFEVPVAAASLGQVYRATLVSGEPVAVKVQRPDVLQSVTLDLYVIRILLLFLSKYDNFRDSALSILGVIDNWADRFLQELDYLQEARNGARFREDMAASKTLGEAILVPRVYDSLTSRYVLVTDWVEGVKVDAIDSSTEEGRQRLKKIVATLLNSYLAQLLESGFLHADPHPGNFLCTPDGKLCVLDMGLMTEVSEDQRYALLEYVSHLTAKDYEATLNDLIVLGFIPKEIGEDPEKAGIVAPLLGTVLEQLSNGGGAKSVTVESVGEEVEELGRQYPIVIPSYFGLIIRAFSALEGLGLQLDPQYSIVNECFPYLARRLLTEDSDRMRKMLRTFLYGREGRYLQVDRVDDLVEGYSQFTALADEASKGVTIDGISDPLGRRHDSETAAPATAEPASQLFGTPAGASDARRLPSPGGLFGGGGGGGGVPSPAFAAVGAGEGTRRGQDKRFVDPVDDPVARDALKLLFSKEGNYVQELVVEELVRMTDALSREANLQMIQALRTLVEAPLSPTRIARALVEAPLNPLLAPLQVPVKAQAFALSRVFSRLEVALELTQEDQESLKALRRLQELLQGGIDGVGTGAGPEAGAGGRQIPNPLGLPLPPLPIPAAFSLLPGGGGAMGPREAADAARQFSGLVSMIGPGALAIGQKFLVQLTARTLDRLADSFEDPQKGVPPGEQASAQQATGRFYADDAP